MSLQDCSLCRDNGTKSGKPNCQCAQEHGIQQHCRALAGTEVEVALLYMQSVRQNNQGADRQTSLPSVSYVKQHYLLQTPSQSSVQ